MNLLLRLNGMLQDAEQRRAAEIIDMQEVMPAPVQRNVLPGIQRSRAGHRQRSSLCAKCENGSEGETRDCGHRAIIPLYIFVWADSAGPADSFGNLLLGRCIT